MGVGDGDTGLGWVWGRVVRDGVGRVVREGGEGWRLEMGMLVRDEGRGWGGGEGWG